MSNGGNSDRNCHSSTHKILTAKMKVAIVVIVLPLVGLVIVNAIKSNRDSKSNPNST